MGRIVLGRGSFFYMAVTPSVVKSSYNPRVSENARKEMTKNGAYKMNFMRTKIIVLGAILIRILVAPRAVKALMTGKGTPGADYIPVTTLGATVPTVKTLQDIERNSAEINGKVVTQIAGDANSVRGTATEPVSAAATPPSQPDSSAAKNPPCPRGYVITRQFQNGNADCERDSTPDAATGNYLATKLTVDASGKGLVHTGSIDGSTGTYTYGRVLELYENGPVNNPTILGKYESFYLASPDEATALLQHECSLGHAVTYNGPAGRIINGVPTSGYQVKVVRNLPGTSTPSPIPPGETNICPATPPPTTGANPNAPCPTGYIAATRYNSGYVDCEQASTDPNTGYTVDNTFTLDPQGNGVLTNGNFGDPDGPYYSYGHIGQRVTDSQGTDVAQYDDYFFASQQDANAVAFTECGSYPVSYVGPSGNIDPNTGAPAGGWQVQVVTSDLGNPYDLSQMPPGGTNACLTVRPPSGN